MPKETPELESLFKGAVEELIRDAVREFLHLPVTDQNREEILRRTTQRLRLLFWEFPLVPRFKLGDQPELQDFEFPTA